MWTDIWYIDLVLQINSGQYCNQLLFHKTSDKKQMKNWNTTVIS